MIYGLYAKVLNICSLISGADTAVTNDAHFRPAVGKFKGSGYVACFHSRFILFFLLLIFFWLSRIVFCLSILLSFLHCLLVCSKTFKLSGKRKKMRLRDSRSCRSVVFVVFVQMWHLFRCSNSHNLLLMQALWEIINLLSEPLHGHRLDHASSNSSPSKTRGSRLRCVYSVLFLQVYSLNHSAKYSKLDCSTF